MIITIAHYKGGVGKTTTAYHFAAYLATLAPTLLIDNDPNHSSLRWARRSGGVVPFKVVPQSQGAMFAGQYKHVVHDTRAREDGADLPDIVEGCHLLVLPTEPGTMELESVQDMVSVLRKHNIDPHRYRVLVTKAPSYPERDGELLHEALAAAGVPLFQTIIHFYKVYKKAVTAGVLVYDIKERRAQDAWAEYKKACEEVVTP